MAHSALVSLMNTLELTVHSDRFDILPMKQHILSIYRKVRFLQTLFQDAPKKSSEEEMNSLEIQIINVAYAIEDIVELDALVQFVPESFPGLLDSVLGMDPSSALEKAMMVVDSIVEELLKDGCGLKYFPSRKYSSVGYLPIRGGKSAMMVGFDEDVIELKDRLTGQESKRGTISLVGMGGIGKTTLAKNLYNDSLIKYHFDVRAWVTISQTYYVRDVLQCLLEGFGVAINESQKKDISDLAQSLYQNLKGRRYLIVLDDMWSIEVWDDLKRMFPDDVNGSRIMLTTRLVDVAAYATDSSSPPHQMRLLDEDKSWDLLCREAFGEEGCPSKLEDIGKIIAHNCRGLPLATSVIGGLLAKSSKTRDYWEYVAQNVNSIAISSDEHCSEILALSYKYLPHHLQPCFLYFGIFPEDYVISVAKLIKLWIAEGMLKPFGSKRLEEVAEECLKDLIDRNLIFVHRKGSNGKTRTCGIHDLLRDLCRREGQKENFHQINGGSFKFSPDDISIRIRLSMHLDVLDVSDVDIGNAIRSMAFARSLLCNGRILHAFPFYICLGLLRVLDILGTEFLEFPVDILSLVNLRYLALSFRRFPGLPSEMSKLWKLQILIVEDYENWLNRLFLPYWKSSAEVCMPSEILQMAQLRHLHMTECFLPDQIDGSDPVVLKDLETLSAVTNFRCTEEVLNKFPNLQKLVVYYYSSDIEDWSNYHLKNLVQFSKLENLKCIFKCPPNDTLLPSMMFPQSLRKLTLSGSKFFWKDMRIIGSLPYLEVLKLREYACMGAVWETIEGEFCRLKFLHVERTNLMQWIAENTHFPCLEHLIIEECHDLEAIPSSIGEIGTLKLIEIDDCSSSAAASAERILEEQQSLENHDLQVHVHRGNFFS